MFVPYDATLSKQNNTLQMHTTSMYVFTTSDYQSLFLQETFCYFEEITEILIYYETFVISSTKTAPGW